MVEKKKMVTFLKLIRSIFYCLFPLNPEKSVIYLYRFGHYFHKRRCKILAWLFEQIIYYKHNCCIRSKVDIGKNIHFPHPIGIVLGEQVKLGHDVTVYQNVTIGLNKNDGKCECYPKIGNNVTIYAGAIIIGNIRIGDNSVVAASSVVKSSVKDHMLVYGCPAVERPININ